jgi:hypothetical protein
MSEENPTQAEYPGMTVEQRVSLYASIRDCVSACGDEDALYYAERRAVDYVYTLLAAKDTLIFQLKKGQTWDDERRNKFFSLVESYAHKHRQFYYPENGIEDDVREDIQNLWGIRAQLAEMLGIPPLPKDEAQS